METEKNVNKNDIILRDILLPLYHWDHKNRLSMIYNPKLIFQQKLVMSGTLDGVEEMRQIKGPKDCSIK